MTKTPRTSSYLRSVTRQHDSHLLILKPAHKFSWQSRTLPFHDRATEMTPPGYPSSVRANSLPLPQDPLALTSQQGRELPPALVTTTTARPGRDEAAPSPSSPQPSALHTPIVVAGSPPQPEGTPPAKSQWTDNAPLTSTVRDQKPAIRPAPAKSQHESNAAAAVEPASADRYQQAEIQLVPAKSTPGVAVEMSGKSTALQGSSARQTGTPGKEKPVTVPLHPAPRQRASGKEKPATVTLHPLSMPQQEATTTPTSSRRPVDFLGQGSKVSTRASEREQQHTAIHIGTIDIHIVPPAPPAPLPPARSATARSHSSSTLSREMTSFIGLRQG